MPSSDDNKVVPLPRRASKAQPCPICGKPAVPEARPFCSQRCAEIDLGRWLKGNYRIATQERPEDDEAPQDEPA